MKIFGIELFNRNRGTTLFNNALQNIKKDKYLPDFKSQAQHFVSDSYISITQSSITGTLEVSGVNKKEESNDGITPKEVFNLKMLNDKQFKMDTSAEYIEKSLKSFREKLSLLNLKEGDYMHGFTDIKSIIIRLENRKKYSKFNSFYDQFPYTVDSKINKVMSRYTHLKMDTVDRFIPDLPDEAIKVMSEYKNQTKKLCNLYPIFYMIANKKDFEKTTVRKDPILLVQSPFGHFWQILGAWDEEILLLEKL